MDATPLDPARRYHLKHTSRVVQARVSSVVHALGIDVANAPERTSALALNGIALVDIETVLPLAADTYADNRITGAFILIDPESNATVAAGMIRRFAESTSAASTLEGPVTSADRLHRWGHPGAVVALHAPASLVDAVERALFNSGVFTVRAEPSSAAALAAQGVVALTIDVSDDPTFRVTIGALTSTGTLADTSITDAVSSILALFRQFETQEKGSPA